MSVETLRRLTLPTPPAARRSVIRGVGTALRRVGQAAWKRRTGLVIFLLPLALYVVLGALLAFRYESFNGDAQSRVANAYYVLFSRDPHLGAIGFVWNPLPSLSVLPLLLFKGIWPALASRAFAGNIMSAAFMAGCVVLVHAILRDLNVRRSARLVLTVLFAIQPMIVYYGANGMSEAIFLFFLLLTCRRLSRWLADGQTWDLVLAGTALAFAYLARYEAVLPAVIAAGVVAAVTAVRTSGDLRLRTRSAALNGFVFAVPAFFAFVMWAVISWVIVGHPFEQLSSQYGNTAQLGAVGEIIDQSRGGIGASRYVVLQWAGLAPMLPLAIATAGWTAVRRRDLRLLAPAAVFGGVAAFAVLAFLGGQTTGWLRYYIAVIPLCTLLAGCALARPTNVRPGWGWLRAAVAGGLGVAIALPGIVTSALVMTDHRIGREEYQHLGYLLDHQADPAVHADRHRYTSAEAVARYLDSKGLAAGSVLTDTFTPCVPFVVLASRHPHQFVITNDRDFKPVLADPTTFDTSYILIPPRDALGDLDEINRTYPTLYASGAGIAVLDHEFDGDGGCPAFRLYRLLPGGSGSGTS